MAKPWTAEELAIMKQRYPKEGASDALVKTLNRTKQAIHFKAQQVGLRNVKRKRFTDEDIEILRERYPNEGASKDIQKLLCRSAATINRKARLLGIKGTRHYWTEEKLKILAERYPKEGQARNWCNCFSAVPISSVSRLTHWGSDTKIDAGGPRKRRIFSLRGILGKVQARVF